MPEHVGRAFGLTVEADFAVVGLAPATERPAERRVRLELCGEADVAGRGETVLERLLPDGRPVHRVEVCEDGAYVLDGTAFGRFRVDPGAERVHCAPRRRTAWRWQRYLTGHVLPLVAVLRGLEALHASAVVLAGRGVAFAGPTHAGKSSVALSLVADGAPFLADDVVTLEAAPAGVTVHPATGVANLRAEAAEVLGPRARERLGSVLGRTRDTLRVVPARRGGPCPLAALYFLDRRPDVRELRRTPVEPRTLLAGTFQQAVQTPERLRNLLETSAALYRSAAAERVEVPPSLDAVGLARRIRGWHEP